MEAKQGAEESLAILELRDESAERERVKIADELHETKAELYKIQKQLGCLLVVLLLQAHRRCLQG